MYKSCASAWTRWSHSQCYCPTGLYYNKAVLQDGDTLAMPPRTMVSSSISDTVTTASAQILEEISSFQQNGTDVLCSVRGLDLWEARYLIYMVAVFSFFCGAAAWFVVQLVRLRNTTEKMLRKAIYGFSLGATFVRLCYLITEGSMVFSGNAVGEKFGGITYSSFFPLSASAFLSICQHWLRLIYVMEDAEEPVWHRNPLFIVCLALLSLEALYDMAYLIGSPPMLDAVYFVWLTLISFFVALVGLCITWRLYGHLRDFYGSLQAFRKVMAAAFSISMLATSFLALSVVQAVFGRFYAWPSLSCWIVGRLLEAAYLTVIILAFGPANAAEPRSTATTQSFGSSASLGDYPHVGFVPSIPTRLENFWIATAPIPRRGTAPAGWVPNHEDTWGNLSMRGSNSTATQDESPPR